ncbi:MAG TPA: hypothetical protein VHM19_08660, partial [Polyangiales bacterium]|nr:hypothetical protein [Polyangiales bacterium]
VEGLGHWGQRWAKRAKQNKDLDPVLLMWDLRRRLALERLPKEKTVVQFWFRDMPSKRSRYWLLIDQPEVDLCLTRPGFDVSLTVETTLRTMAEVWMGDRDLREAMQQRDIELSGEPKLARAFPGWLMRSVFAGTEPA